MPEIENKDCFKIIAKVLQSKQAKWNPSIRNKDLQTFTRKEWAETMKESCDYSLKEEIQSDYFYLLKIREEDFVVIYSAIFNEFQIFKASTFRWGAIPIMKISKLFIEEALEKSI